MRASVEPTDVPEKGLCGSMRFRTLVLTDPFPVTFCKCSKSCRRAADSLTMTGRAIPAPIASVDDPSRDRH
jgi:hypothetical protein